MQITRTARFALIATALMTAAPLLAAPASAATRTDVSPKETLATLQKLLPANLKQSQPKSLRGDQEVFNDAFVTVNDGKGASLTEVQVGYVTFDFSCADEPNPETCRVRPDGSTIITGSSPNYRDEVGINSVTIYHRDHSFIFLSSANGTAYKHTKPTRKTPPLTTTQLTKLADNPAWRFPR